jgi:hypothetical protein
MKDAKKEEYKFTITNEKALYLVAAENGIDISKVLKPEELAEVREAIRSAKTVQVNNRVPVDVKKPVIVNLDKETKINCPNVPTSILKDAKKMSEVYPYFYVFENSVRYFIIDTLESKYGKDWWALKVSSKSRGKATDRQNKEGRNRWHGKRGEHPIFYVDIDDLQKIITSNFEDFKNQLPAVDRPVEWLTNRIEEVEQSRNIIAHNNPLSDDDITRVRIYFKDWIKQIAEQKPTKTEDQQNGQEIPEEEGH